MLFLPKLNIIVCTKIIIKNNIKNNIKWTKKIMNKNVAGNKKIEEKAIDWILNGNVGLSSKTMWACFMNAKTGVNHPHDPSDFGRCYKLLEKIPEWKKELPKLKTLSKEWESLINNWSELSRMYENQDDEVYNYMQLILKPLNQDIVDKLF